MGSITPKSQKRIGSQMSKLSLGRVVEVGANISIHWAFPGQIWKNNEKWKNNEQKNEKETLKRSVLIEKWKVELPSFKP